MLSRGARRWVLNKPLRSSQYHSQGLSILDELKKCSWARDLDRGKQIHAAAAARGVSSDLFVASSLVNMYSKCGSMPDALKVFNEIQHPSVVTWTCLILGYAENGDSEIALETLCRMRRGGCSPDALTFVAALKACGTLPNSLEVVMCLHAHTVRERCDSATKVANTLVDVYSKCGFMIGAQQVFDRMKNPDVVSWNCLISGYAENGEEKLALRLFSCMEKEGCLPDPVTYVSALRACTNLARREEGCVLETLKRGMALHSQVAKSGCECDVYVASAMVDMYAKCGSMMQAQSVFDRMSQPNAVSRNCLLMGYAQNGEEHVALDLFWRTMRGGHAPNPLMFVVVLKVCSSLATQESGRIVEGRLVKVESLESGKAIHSQAVSSRCDTDVKVSGTLVDMYAKCGSMSDAQEVFDTALHRDVVSWNCLISGYAENGNGKLALELFLGMDREGCAASVQTILAALKACSMEAALQTGRAIHRDICSRGLDNDEHLASSLVDFYGKCGSLAEAQQVFDSVATKNLVTWNALMAAYSRHGHKDMVFHLFHRMQSEQVQPDGATCLCVLSSCSHAGLVEKGKEHFKRMVTVYKVKPDMEHYNCMVDILARANELGDGMAMLKSMPFQPNAVTWKSILSACRKWKNVALGRSAFESLLRLGDEGGVAGFDLMTSIYRDDSWDGRSEVVQSMRMKACNPQDQQAHV